MAKLSPITKAYILCSILAGVGILGYYALHFDVQNLAMLAVLSGLASLSLIFKVEGTTNRSHYNISFLIYSFTFVVLGAGPAIFVILVSNLVEWAWHRYPWYIQSFNISSYLIAIFATDLAHKWVNPSIALFSWAGILGLLVAMAVFTAVNHLLIGGIVWLARGENFAKSGIFGFLPLMIDFTLLTMGTAAALAWMQSPFAIILTLIPLYLIYSTLKVPALERQTETDPKTGLFNARYFEHALQTELTRAERFDRPLTVVMADLDLLRNINNTYGHLAGDQVLIGVAKILKQYTRDYDVVCRFGGEEFAILVPEAVPQEVYPRIDLIREAIEKAEFTVQTSVTPIKITMSFGIAGREGFGHSASEIIHNADAALYYAKLKGRNRTFVYSSELEESFIAITKDSPPVKNVENLEERAQYTRLPFQPSSLREPPPVNQEAQEQAAQPVDKEAQEQPTQPGVPANKRSKRVPVNIYISALALTALVLFAVNLYPVSTIDFLGLFIFVGIVILTEWISIDIYVRETSISTSAAPIIAGNLLFGPLGAIALSISFAFVALLKHRSAFNRFIFNASNQMIAGLLLTIMIRMLGNGFHAWSMPLQLIMSVLSGCFVYLSTTCLITVAMHLDMGLPLYQIWKEKFSWLVPYYTTMGLIAFALIFSFEEAGLMGVTVILVPLLLLRFSQKQYIDRTRAIVNELREKNLILQKNSEEINSLNDGLFETLAEVIDLRDPFVLGHSKQVSHYSVLIAQQLNLPAKRVELIRKASFLHDIGKIGIPESILLKPAALTSEEYKKIQEHVTLGADILETSRSLVGLIPIVRHHHERFDGKGYPDRLKGKNIPLEARVVAVADAVEAMASDRPYRKGMNYQEILLEVEKNSGAQFDPVVADAFLQVLKAEGEDILENSAHKCILERDAAGALPFSNNGFSNNGHQPDMA